MITVAISHNLVLSREDRYKLAGGGRVETTGVSLPVWFRKGSTSEPSREVFCRYVLTNEDRPYLVRAAKDGYFINLPQVSEQEEELKKMPAKLAELLGANLQKYNSKSLLDVKDGGSEWMQFRQYNKTKKNGRTVNIIHFVEIRPIEELIVSLC